MFHPTIFGYSMCKLLTIHNPLNCLPFYFKIAIEYSPWIIEVPGKGVGHIPFLLLEGKTFWVRKVQLQDGEKTVNNPWFTVGFCDFVKKGGQCETQICRNSFPCYLFLKFPFFGCLVMDCSPYPDQVIVLTQGVNSAHRLDRIMPVKEI